MAYLDLNRGLYVEGNDWCADHRQAEIFEYFNIEYISFGQNDEVNRITANEECRLGVRDFGYQTGNDAGTRPDRIRPIDGAETILTCNRGHIRGVYYDGDGAYRTYGQSLSFISFNNNYDFDRAEFLLGIINELAGYQGVFRGQVVNNMTSEPVEGALVSIPQCNLSGLTDENGMFEIDRIPITSFEVEVTARGYTTVVGAEYDFNGEHEIDAEIRMLHPEIDLDPYTLQVNVEENHQLNTPINLVNAGDGPLDFSTHIRAVRIEGHPWEQIIAVDAGTETGDTRLQAAIFFQDHFWIAGGGSGAGNPNMFYMINRDGQLVEQWEQAAWSNYGWRDLTEDGEFIYAVDSTYIAQIDPETGEVTGERFPSVLNPTNCIAWDEERQAFWVAGTTTPIIAVDREGNEVGEVTNGGRFRNAGLFYFAEDPDGYPLYITSTTRDREPIIMKANPETDEIMEVLYLPQLVEGEKPGGCDITTELYPFTWTAIIQMQGPEDWIRTYEVFTDFHWISIDPTDAVVEGGGQLSFTLSLDATGLEIDNTYNAFIQFDHNTTLEEMVWIEVEMTVIEEIEDGVDDPVTTPFDFGITSAYPNPFNPSTSLNFTLDRESDLNLAVYDMNGRLMETLINSKMGAGSYSTVLTAEHWPNGIYFVRLTDGDRIDLQKVTLLK